MSVLLVILIIILLLAVSVYKYKPVLESFESVYYPLNLMKSCPVCGNMNSDECSKCINCGYCVKKDGTKTCVAGNADGPFLAKDCSQWNYSTPNLIQESVTPYYLYAENVDDTKGTPNYYQPRELNHNTQEDLYYCPTREFIIETDLLENGCLQDISKDVIRENDY